MSRLIQEELTKLLAEAILFGKLKAVGAVQVEVEGTKLALRY